MAKILLEIEESSFPKDCDMIVYNARKKKWEVVCKDYYLKDFYSQMIKQDEKIAICEKKVKEMQEQVQTMANTIKEGIL